MYLFWNSIRSHLNESCKLWHTYSYSALFHFILRWLTKDNHRNKPTLWTLALAITCSSPFLSWHQLLYMEVLLPLAHAQILFLHDTSCCYSTYKSFFLLISALALTMLSPFPSWHELLLLYMEVLFPLNTSSCFNMLSPFSFLSSAVTIAHISPFSS